MEQPLAGVTALDFGQIYNGPYCGFLLAQAGARVIKVESPLGEPLRARGEPSAASYPFALLNAGKESITLNIKSAAGQAALKRLAREVDVVLENFAPGTMDRYGVGASALRQENPRLIYAAGTGYGATGPHRDYLGMDITIQAMSGIMSVTGQEDTPPLKSGAALCDFFGGVHLYGAIVSALYRRQRTGEGAVIDVAMQDTVFPALATALGGYYITGKQVPRRGNRHLGLSLAPYNVYRAKDGHVAMICLREGHWRRLIKAMDQPELGERPEFADMASRAAHIDEVDAVVETWTETRTRDEIFRIMQAGGVICASVQTLEEVVNDPHLHERGTLEWREHPGLGRIALCRTPLRYEGVTPPELTDVPALGADTQRVLRELGGYGEEDVEALRQAEAF